MRIPFLMGARREIGLAREAIGDSAQRSEREEKGNTYSNAIFCHSDPSLIYKSETSTKHLSKNDANKNCTKPCRNRQGKRTKYDSNLFFFKIRRRASKTGRNSSVSIEISCNHGIPFLFYVLTFLHFPRQIARGQTHSLRCNSVVDNAQKQSDDQHTGS